MGLRNQIIILINIVFLHLQLMRGKTILQQPFRKIQASKHLIININQPPPSPSNKSQHSQEASNYLPRVLQEEINDVKARIQTSEKVLEESRRQANSRQKLVKSNKTPISFNYDSSRRYDTKMQLDPLDERQSEYSLQNEQQEGSVQLPIHLQPSVQQRNYLCVRNTQQNYFSTTDRPSILKNSQNKNHCKTDRRLFLNELTNSLEKRPLSSLLSPRKTPKKNIENRPYLQMFSKSKEISNEKKLRRNQGHIKLETRESRSKSKDKNNLDSKNKQIQSHQNAQKIKIKLNNPTAKQDPKTQYTTRQRHHIQMPATNYFTTQEQNKVNNKPTVKQFSIKNEWENLWEKIQKYQFVRKYLTESDVHQICEYLKRNHINQDKWPLFIVEEALKKINGHKNQ